MKLATLKDGTRDGRLVVVSRDLTHCADAGAIAPTLQAALDDWTRAEPPLRALADQVERGAVPLKRFREREAMAPLPRAYHWADASAYVNHIELARKARGDAAPETLMTDPMMYQGGSDAFLGPREPILVEDDAFGVDLEGEIAVISDDTPMGVSEEEAAAAIRLVMLVNDVSLRGLVPAEIAKGFGFIHAKPSTAFSPVAVTPDALGEMWRDGRLYGKLHVDVNGQPLGRAWAGGDMIFNFPRLVAHSARTRRLSAGALIGAGTVSNKGPDGTPGKPVAEGGAGYSCIVEQRMVETLLHGAPRTPFLRFGDMVRIWMPDADGHSIFGAIEQSVERYHRP